jgi:hypothetical protein
MARLTKFTAVETFVKELQTVFEQSGLTALRGNIPISKQKQALIARYVVTDSLRNEADDTWNSLRVYVNLTVFINHQKGFDYPAYQTAMDTLETKCIEKGYTFEIGIDSSDYTIGDISSIAKSKELEITALIKNIDIVENNEEES